MYTYTLTSFTFDGVNLIDEATQLKFSFYDLVVVESSLQSYSRNKNLTFKKTQKKFETSEVQPNKAINLKTKNTQKKKKNKTKTTTTTNKQTKPPIQIYIYSN